jgi:hypothetical protein
MTKVEDMDKCNNYLGRLKANGWSLYQMQYSYDEPTGFIATFWKEGQTIELVTWDKEIQDKMIIFNDKK